MSRCVALVHSRRFEPSWAPCTRDALPRGLFCALHREQLEGALLGYYFVTEAPHAEKEQREAAREAQRQARRTRTLRRKRRRAKTAAAGSDAAADREATRSAAETAPPGEAYADGRGVA